jgi:hypothetical protein
MHYNPLSNYVAVSDSTLFQTKTDVMPKYNFSSFMNTYL